MMTFKDLEIMEKDHSLAAEKVKNFCVSVVDAMAVGDKLTKAQYDEYALLKADCIKKKAELAKMLDAEFEDVIYGGGR